jgi:hypothetical protein
VGQVSSSDKAGKSFAARLDVNLVVKGRLVTSAGSKVYGRVESSRSAGRAFGKSKLALSLRRIVVDGRPVAIATGNYEESGPRSGRKTAGRAAAGALVGFAFGGPAAVAAIGLIGQGKSVEAPAGTLFEFRLTRPDLSLSGVRPCFRLKEETQVAFSEKAKEKLEAEKTVERYPQNQL